MLEAKSLQLDDKIDLHRKGWVAQSILGTLVALFVLGGALGVFGDGLLSKQTVGEEDSSLWMEYDRFARKDAPMHIEIHLASANTSTVVGIPANYLKNFKVEAITPTPNSVTTQEGVVHYTFSAKGQFTVLFHFKPNQMGKHEGRITVNSQSYHLNHFIYP